MRKHRVKCWPQFFQATEVDGTKPFTLRKNDRDYQVGDALQLQEYLNDAFTGAASWQRVTYVLDSTMVDGLKPGYVVLGLAPFDPNALPEVEK